MPSFFQWRSVKVVEFILATVGFVLTVYHIWEGVFAEGKALRAEYKFSLLAESGDTFPLGTFVRPDVAEFDRVVDLGVILWNAGGQIISHNDIRGDEHSLIIELELGNASILIENGSRPGRQGSSIQNNFQFQPRGHNTFALTWQAMDPGDFFQVHFLIASKLGKGQIDNIGVKFSGSVTGTKGNV
jgi:hypothetical protein